MRGDLELAQALLQLAQDQRNAGVATGVDVTRAQARLAEQRVGLAQAQTDSEQARLNLQRMIGLPLGSALTLTDQLRFVEEPLPLVDTAVTQAANDRREIKVAEEESRVSKLELQSVRAEHLPSLEVVGDYGSTGITPDRFDVPDVKSKIYVLDKKGLTERQNITVDLPCRLIQVRRGKPPGGTHAKYGTPNDCYLVLAIGSMYVGDGFSRAKYQTSLYKVAVVL